MAERKDRGQEQVTIDAYYVKAFVIVTTIAIIAFDVYLFQDRVAGNTISSVLREWFKKMRWLYYLVSFALGVLMSHWGPFA